MACAGGRTRGAFGQAAWVWVRGACPASPGHVGVLRRGVRRAGCRGPAGAAVATMACVRRRGLPLRRLGWRARRLAVLAMVTAEQVAPGVAPADLCPSISAASRNMQASSGRSDSQVLMPLAVMMASVTAPARSTAAAGMSSSVRGRVVSGKSTPRRLASSWLAVGRSPGLALPRLATAKHGRCPVRSGRLVLGWTCAVGQAEGNDSQGDLRL
jgi:hypothetical protein